MTYKYVDHLMNDRIQRLAVGRANAMAARGARWAAPRDGKEGNSASLRTENVVKAGSTSIIDNPMADRALHNMKKRNT